MECNNKLKETVIENGTFFCFDDIIKIEDFDFNNHLRNEKSYKNVSIYDISYKTLTAVKPLHIRFDKINWFIRVHDGTKYLVL